MAVNKRKKASRMRGSHTHGWGAKKKHRGAGSRGGRGNAGTGKKADTKKPSIWKNKKYFGKFGFKKKGVIKKINPVNIKLFEQNADKLLEKKLITKQEDTYIIDAQKLGFNKVLGCAKLTKKLKITAESFSKKAVEKIKKAGGEAVKIKQKEKKTAAKKEIKQKPLEKSEQGK